MKVKVEKAGGCRRILQVEVGPEGVVEVHDGVLESFRKAARIPGFRVGRAPAVVVDRRYSKEIAEETKERLLPRLYREAVNKEKLDVAAVVDVADVRFERGTGISFRVTLDVAPEIKLPKYRKIALKDETKPVTDEDVDSAIAQLRERAARFEEVSSRPVKRGDLVQVNYRGVSGGRPVGEICPDCAGMGQATDFWALVDEPGFLPGIASQIEGMQVGETRTVQVSFPGDHQVEAVRGLIAEYEITVKALRERVLPVMDEAFLKSLGFETWDKLKERARADLEEGTRGEEDNRRRNEIARFLLEHVSCELPESVVAREADLTARSMVRRFAYQGATREQIEKRSDEILGSAHRSSVDRVKMGFILKSIADEEKIETTEEEVVRELSRLASARRQTPEHVRQELEEQGTMDDFREHVRADKTMDFLLGIGKAK